MSNDDILCEHPGPNGRVCTLPYGHEPANVHAFEVELPHDLAQIIEGFIAQSEEARVRYEKEYKKTKRMYWFFLGAFTLYVVMSIWTLVTL